jgi:uncharacterized protein (TIGR02598 family)
VKTRRSKNSSRQSGGFSLIEIVIAIGLAAFAIVGLIGLMPQGLTTLKQSRSDSLRAEILKSVANTAKQTDFSLISSLNGTNFYFDADGVLVTSGSPDALYQAVLGTNSANVPASGSSYTLPGAIEVSVNICRKDNTNSESTTHTLIIPDNGR